MSNIEYTPCAIIAAAFEDAFDHDDSLVDVDEDMIGDASISIDIYHVGGVLDHEEKTLYHIQGLIQQGRELAKEVKTYMDALGFSVVTGTYSLNVQPVAYRDSATGAECIAVDVQFQYREGY